MFRTLHIGSTPNSSRRYRAVDPDNRLVARGLEREWEKSLRALEAARVDLAQRERQRPCRKTMGG